MTIPFVVVTGPTGLRRCAARRPRTPPAAHSPRFPRCSGSAVRGQLARREARALRRGYRKQVRSVRGAPKQGRKAVRKPDGAGEHFASLRLRS